MSNNLFLLKNIQTEDQNQQLQDNRNQQLSQNSEQSPVSTIMQGQLSTYNMLNALTEEKEDNYYNYNSDSGK